MTRRIRLALLLVSLGLTLGAGGVARAHAAGATRPATFKLNEKVEVREGDEWSSATVVKKEGRKYQIRYEDGTEEWVTTDRLRAAGTTTPAAAAPAGTGKKRPTGKTTPKAGSGKAAKPAPKEGDGLDDDGDAAPAKPKPKKDVFALGAKVEVKQANAWNKATVKNRDGDLYLVVVDGWEQQFHWQWVHVLAVRKIGSDKEFPGWSNTVGVHNKSIEEAKEEAKTKFANIEQEVAANKASGKSDPFAPVAYDKELAEPVTDKSEDLLPAAPAGKLETFDAVDTKVKMATRPIALKKPGGRVLLGGTRGLVVHATGYGAEERTVNVELLDLTTARNGGLTKFDPLSIPLALSPSGGRVLGRAPGHFANQRSRIDLFAVTPGGGSPKHQVSFKPYAGEKQSDVEWAAFVDEDHVLTCNNEGKLIFWNAPRATAVWHMTIKPASYPALSANRKQLAVLTSGELVVLDAMKGDGICAVPVSRPATTLSFTPDGKRVFGSTGTTVVFWDLASGEFGAEIGLPAKGAGGAAPVAASGRFVLVGGRDLLDLDNKAVIWRYEPAAGAPPAGAFGAPPPALAHNGRCWSVVSEGEKSILTSATLPHKAARAAAEKVKPEQLLLVKPGATVSLSVTIEGPADAQQRIVNALTAQLAQHNIKVDNASPIRLVAKTENGKTEQRSYQRFGFGGRGQETVAVTEKISRIYFEHNGQIAWEAKTTTNASMMVNAKEGQTIAQAVLEANKPDLAFLERAQVPAYVPRPTDTPWLGVSRWTLNGVTDEPGAAAFKPAAGEGDGLQ